MCIALLTKQQETLLLYFSKTQWPHDKTIRAVFLMAGLERDKFDNKTVTFEEHIKEEHNMWHYLFFIVLVKVKDSTEYTGPESYVAEMIKVNAKHAHTLKTKS